jgi:hypothetical protein
VLGIPAPAVSTDPETRPSALQDYRGPTTGSAAQAWKEALQAIIEIRWPLSGFSMTWFSEVMSASLLGRAPP